jgi:hypothetical protein
MPHWASTATTPDLVEDEGDRIDQPVAGPEQGEGDQRAQNLLQGLLDVGAEGDPLDDEVDARDHEDEHQRLAQGIEDLVVHRRLGARRELPDAAHDDAREEPAQQYEEKEDYGRHRELAHGHAEEV